MALYHVHAELPEFTDEIAALVPGHRAYINRMFEEGKLVSYSVAANIRSLWAVIDADEEQQALEVIAGMPMQHLFTDVQSSLLLFHNAVPAPLPSISLN